MINIFCPGSHHDRRHGGPEPFVPSPGGKGVPPRPVLSVNGVAPGPDGDVRMEDIEIPTNVSAFENDAGYLTEHQDVSGIAAAAEEAKETADRAYEGLGELENDVNDVRRTAEEALSSAESAGSDASEALQKVQYKLDYEGTAYNSTRLGGLMHSSYAKKTDLDAKLDKTTAQSTYATKTDLSGKFDKSGGTITGFVTVKSSGGVCVTDPGDDTVSTVLLQGAVLKQVGDDMYSVSIPDKSGTFALTDDIPDVSDFATKEEIPDVSDIVPSRLKNDTDTERIDGSGNVYSVENSYDGGSWTAVGTLSGTGSINLTFTDCKKVGNNYQWTNPDDPSMTLRIEPSGVLYWNYVHGGSRGISTNVTRFDVFGGYQFASVRDSTVTLTHSNTNRVPMESETPTDRLARESQLANKLDKANAVLNGDLQTTYDIWVKGAGTIKFQDGNGHYTKLSRAGLTRNNDLVLPQADGTLALEYAKRSVDGTTDPFTAGFTGYIPMYDKTFAHCSISASNIFNGFMLFLSDTEFSDTSAGKPFDSMLIVDVASDFPTSGVSIGIWDRNFSGSYLTMPKDCDLKLEPNKRYLLTVTVFGTDVYDNVYCALNELKKV